jgi:hypothetical protein
MAAKKNDSASRKRRAHRAQVDSETEYNRKAKAHVAAMKREQSRRVTAAKKKNDAQHKRMVTSSQKAERDYERRVANRRKQGDSPSTASKRSKAKVRARKNAMGQKNPRWGTKNV